LLIRECSVGATQSFCKTSRAGVLTTGRIVADAVGGQDVCCLADGSRTQTAIKLDYKSLVCFVTNLILSLIAWSYVLHRAGRFSATSCQP
jgi:hypothetical protein